MTKRYKILLIEDSEEICDLLSFVFEAKGFQVSVANDGLSAMELPLNEFDAIILDLQMPNMDGKQFLQVLRHKQSLQTPVVMFTSHERDGLEAELKEAGANKVIAKPASADRLIKEVLDLIESR